MWAHFPETNRNHGLRSCLISKQVLCEVIILWWQLRVDMFYTRILTTLHLYVQERPQRKGDYTRKNYDDIALCVYANRFHGMSKRIIKIRMHLFV